MKTTRGNAILRYLLPLIALLALAAPACVSNRGPVSDVDFLDADTPAPPVAAPVDSGLPLAIKQRFPDIPLPADLREDSGRTYVYQAPGLDIGRMVYTSRDSVRDLAQFFIRELPAKDWTLRSSTQAENSVDLIFTKLNKRLEIKVSSGGMTRSNELVLHLVPQAESVGNFQ